MWSVLLLFVCVLLLFLVKLVFALFVPMFFVVSGVVCVLGVVLCCSVLNNTMLFGLAFGCFCCYYVFVVVFCLYLLLTFCLYYFFLFG